MKKIEKGYIVNTCQFVYMVLNLKCLLSVLIPSRKHPISPSRNHRVGHLSHETTARFCKACPWKEPGFNVPADARMGWLSFLGARWVDSLGFGRQISLVLILWLNFFLKKHEEEGNSTGKVIGKGAVVFWFG